MERQRRTRFRRVLLVSSLSYVLSFEIGEEGRPIRRGLLLFATLQFALIVLTRREEDPRLEGDMLTTAMVTALRFVCISEGGRTIS